METGKVCVYLISSWWVCITESKMLNLISELGLMAKFVILLKWFLLKQKPNMEKEISKWVTSYYISQCRPNYMRTQCVDVLFRECRPLFIRWEKLSAETDIRCMTGKCLLALIDPVYVLQLRHAKVLSLLSGRLIISIPLYIKGLNIHGVSLYIKERNEEAIVTLTSYEP